MAEPSTLQLINAFIQKTLPNITNNSTNSIYSPMSIYYAMTMVYHGMGDSPSKEQLAKVLGLNSQSVLPILTDIKSKVNFQHTSVFKKLYESRLCNGLFIQKRFPIHQQYIEDMKTIDATVSSVQFPEEMNSVNEWISEATKNKIDALLKPGDLTPDTIGVIVNTIYFNANWETKFETINTHKAQFHRLDGSTIKVDMMHILEDYGMYYEDEKVQVWEKNYALGRAAMGFILPKNATEINFDNIEHIIKNLEKKCVEPFIPKFKCETRIDMKQAFETMGVTDLFIQGKAGLSGITPDPDVCVNGIIHQAVIEVDEDGTEAAAATAVIMRSNGYRKPEDPITFEVNHTFGWYIRHYETGIMFNGLQNF